MTEERVRTALCLCGGGIAGAMYEIGALLALEDFLAGPVDAGGGNHDGKSAGAPGRGFTVNDFDLYVGTSAGAFVATMLAAGVGARRLFRAILDNDASIVPSGRSDIYQFDVQQGLGVARDVCKILLFAAARGLRGGLRLSEFLTDLEDALPAGLFSLKHYEKFLDGLLERHQLPMRFTEMRRELYITANDLDSGHRVIFGAGDFVDVPLATAICASSAIPLFFEPVRWRGRDYVDGAVGKVEHADIALARGADLVMIVNPLVPFRNDPDREDLPTPLVGAHHLRDKGLLAVYNQTARMSTRTKLHQGLRRYRASHPQATLLLIEPLEEEGDMFLQNPMNFSARRRILRYGYESAARQLSENQELYRDVWQRHHVQVDAHRLQAPWELVG